MLREQSLFSILGDQRFLRRSIEGLRKEHAMSFEMLKQWYAGLEAYEEADLMAKKWKQFDADHSIWVRPDNGYPVIIERKPTFSKTEVLVIARQTGIDFSIFEAVASAVQAR